MSYEAKKAAHQAAYETNGLSTAMENFKSEIDYSTPVWIGDPELKNIYRLRLILPSGEEFRSGLYTADVSYCWGVMKDGKKVYVNTPGRIDIRKGVKAGIVQMCKDLGLYGKGMGLLDDSVISTIR